MELSEWCEQAPHGQYFQPIRLRLDGAAPTGSDPVYSPVATATPNASAPAAPSTPPRAADSPTEGGIVADGAAASPGTTTPKRLKRRQKPAPTPPRTPGPAVGTDHDGFVLLPPFQSAHVGANRTVLNVGGPVWAMDWLPHDVYRATTVAASKQKKASGPANKENVSRNVNGTAVTNGTAATGSSKDPLAEWRLLALSTHPPCTVVDGELVKNTPPDHHYDAPKGGRNLVQIWAIPVTKKNTSIVKGENIDRAGDAPEPAPQMVPRLVHAIDHDSGVAWDVHWSPLTHKMGRYRQSRDLLGLLAVAFGDGSVQVFEIPVVSADKLQPEPSEHVVERLQPIAAGQIERIIQLSVRWSPHRPNLLLTGCSDGSVALWNLEELLSKPPAKDSVDDTFDMEPQRRFQDADTVGKQEPFDWGWGWVAVRAVCWSPFDANLFATTGNDSLFKIWDIREPRICFRSHRIRSTWGLAMQWMDDTSVQISGDQGSLYMYDVLSGSYQKLHFHPQIDSPVWDLQFARKGRFPILLSSCTSGSLRVAPAKKIFRAPQHSVEFCRLYGEKHSNVELPHKSLTLSFEHRIVSGSAEAASPATREFCERDASLHRVRLSTNESGEYPCFLAAGGHAGLVILMEMQDSFDNLFENYFLQPSKKIGRPRKAGVKANSPWGGRQIGQDKPKKVVAPPKIKRVGNINLSSFAQMSGVTGKSKVKAKKPVKEAEYPEIQIESPSEAEYQDGESESESEELSLDENSDDDRVVGSDGDEESDEVEIVESAENSSTARMRHEYQMDLSEEDAILLAIQMSELEQTTPQKPLTDVVQATNSSGQDQTNGPRDDPEKKSKPAKKNPSSQKKMDSSLARKPGKTASVKKAPQDANAAASSNITPSPVLKPPPASKKAKPLKSSPNKSVLASAKKEESARKQSKSSDGSKSTPMPAEQQAPVQPEAMYDEEMDQSAIQMHIYQQGMTEEDALREALRMSEMGHMRRSNRKRKAPQVPTAAPDTPITRRSPPSEKRHKSIALASNETPVPTVAAAESVLSPDEVARRLEFASTSPPPAIESTVAIASTIAPASSKQSDKQQIPPLPPKPRAKPASLRKNKVATKKLPTSAAAASEASADAPDIASYSTPKQPTRKSSEKGSTTTKSTKKTPTSSAKKAKVKRASSSGAGQFLTDEELLAIALQTSQIEY